MEGILVRDYVRALGHSQVGMSCRLLRTLVGRYRPHIASSGQWWALASCMVELELSTGSHSFELCHRGLCRHF
jgi:hypothetical protein